MNKSDEKEEQWKSLLYCVFTISYPYFVRLISYFARIIKNVYKNDTIRHAARERNLI